MPKVRKRLTRADKIRLAEEAKRMEPIIAAQKEDEREKFIKKVVKDLRRIEGLERWLEDYRSTPPELRDEELDRLADYNSDTLMNLQDAFEHNDEYFGYPVHIQEEAKRRYAAEKESIKTPAKQEMEDIE